MTNKGYLRETEIMSTAITSESKTIRFRNQTYEVLFWIESCRGFLLMFCDMDIAFEVRDEGSTIHRYKWRFAPEHNRVQCPSGLLDDKDYAKAYNGYQEWSYAKLAEEMMRE